ncbi:hypothetical protein HB904_03940 [Listeria booriae]|uniref:Uncharacterized protein n=1 Tax=Listeria booriae TaxID=1552123 RepID=A0A842ABW9_9LIST|nr:hypothetical protein [Listeria booriae]MBC1615323.1 hypothetical protein [Listeria booriae]
MSVIKKIDEQAQETFGWLSNLDDHDKVTINKNDGNRIEATVRLNRSLEWEGKVSPTSLKITETMWFTDVRINSKYIEVRKGKES